MTKWYDFVEHAMAAATVEELTDLLESAFTALGVAAYNFGLTSPSDSSGDIRAPLIISNLDPAWISHYTGQAYFNDDRLVAAAFSQNAPFFYDDVFRTSIPNARQTEMEETFGYRSGIMVPMRLRNGTLGMMSAAHLLGPKEFMTTRWEIMARVQLISTIFLDRLGALREQSQTAPPAISLSPRERECLLWSSRGKSSWEIGAILSISQRTVKKHVLSAMHKLDAATRTQAIVRAIGLALIKP